MSSIQETVESALREAGLTEYISRAKPVITALEEREYDITEQLVSYAAGHGLPTDEAREALGMRGLMSRPAPQVVASRPTGEMTDDERQDELGSIRHDLSNLLERIDRALG